MANQDTFKAIEQLERETFVADRLEAHGMHMKRLHTGTRAVRYMIVATEQNFVLQKDLTFSQVAAYAAQLVEGRD